MPNLVVYVPTSLWKRIEELGLADPKIEARKVARGALESWLSERGVGGVAQPSAAAPGSQSAGLESQRTEKAESAPPARTRSESPPSYFPEREFKPDPKPERKK